MDGMCDYGLIKMKSGNIKLEKLLDDINWPVLSTSGISTKIIMKFFSKSGQDLAEEISMEQDYLDETMNDHKKEKDEVVLNCVISETIINRVPPRIITLSLGIIRGKVYSVGRELGWLLRRKKTGIHKYSRPLNFIKENAMAAMKKFWEENKYIFFAVADVRKQIVDSKVESHIPSLSTVRRWIIKDMGLSLKKVNIGYTEAITQSYLLLKLKYIWIHRSLAWAGRTMVYLDDFNVSSWPIKCHNWTKKCNQNYGFGAKRAFVLNWIVAVIADRPVSMQAHDGSTDADVFITFISKTIEKLKTGSRNRKQLPILIFDNASFHVGEVVNKTLEKDKYTAVTLPPYTPEWNNAEVVINIIERRLDLRSKTEQVRINDWPLVQISDPKKNSHRALIGSKCTSDKQ